MGNRTRYSTALEVVTTGTALGVVLVAVTEVYLRSGIWLVLAAVAMSVVLSALGTYIKYGHDRFFAEIRGYAGQVRRGMARAPLARGTTSLAAWLAGSERDMRNAWLAHLAGDPDAGITLTRWQRAKAAGGFVRAALVYRLTDLCAPLIWVLRKDSRVNGLITFIVGGQALLIVKGAEEAMQALMTEVPEPCLITAGALYVFLRWLRGPLQVDVIPAEPKAKAQMPGE
ncbi:hypothetical protein [Streptomyces sp. NPDC089799]|uniref:hypothetical protein n=1 Tax=Streptomyces sp. NPDC089799 TaxID=3155066 RepID=UPI00341CF923